MVHKILQILVAYEAALLDGASALESTHQCIFLWEGSWDSLPRETLSQRVLLVYCKSLNLSLNCLCKAMTDADIYEDEDFQPLSNGTKRAFAESLFENSSLLIQDLESNIAELLELERGDVAALLQGRLGMHKLYSALNSCISTNIQSARLARKKSTSVAPELLEQMVLLQTHLSSCALTTAKLLGENAISPNLETCNLSTHTDKAAEDVAFAFSSQLVKMMQNSPIRHVDFKPFSPSLKAMSVLCQELGEVCSMVEELQSIAKLNNLTFDLILRTVVAVSQRRFHVVSRSLLVSLLSLLCVDVDAFVLQSLRSHGLPMALVNWELLREYVNQVLGKLCWTTLRSLTVNRNKILIKLDHLLTSWGNTVTEMEEISASFLHVFQIDDEQQQWCQYWAVAQTTLLMDLFMAATIESSLPSRNELVYFFWYWDFICNTRMSALDQLRRLSYALQLRLYEQDLEAFLRLRSSSSSASSKPTPPVEPEQSVDELLQRVRGHLCKGLFRLFVVARKWQLADSSESKYTSWNWRFAQRFRAFQSISNPPMLSHDEFLNVVSLGERGEDDGGKETLRKIIQDAALCFSGAKNLMAEIKRCPAPTVGDRMYADLASPLLKVSFWCLLSLVSISCLTPSPHSSPLHQLSERCASINSFLIRKLCQDSPSLWTTPSLSISPSWTSKSKVSTMLAIISPQNKYKYLDYLHSPL